VTPPGREAYGLRLDKYRRRVRLTVTVGAGLGTLAALLAGILAGGMLSSDPPWLSALVLTLFLVAGGCLAMTFIQFEWCVTLAERELAGIKDPDKKAELLDSLVPEFPGDASSAEYWWTTTRLAVVLTVLAFLAAVWWPTYA
jgi:MFS family permease